MTTLYMDLETRSGVDLRKSNVYRYAEDPTFQILMAAYAFDDGPVEVLLDERSIVELVRAHDGPLVAHNAPFERICLTAAGAPTEAADWIDTQMWAAEAGYPQSLDSAAKALRLETKDPAGTRLINTFCSPPFVFPREKPEQWSQFIEYCRQDVVVLQALHLALPAPTQSEIDLYEVDQRINDRGIEIDVDLAHRAHQAARANAMKAGAEVRDITAVSNANSNQQLMEWFGGLIPNLRAETVEAALEQDDLTSDQRRVLELRQDLALVASKKYAAVLNAVNGDGRLRGQFRFFGAHTGRWSGRGVQMHNLPRAALASEVDVELAIDDLKNGLGADPYTLKALVRPMILGPMVVSDYSAIEARVLAWLASEQWVLEAFKDGRDIYVETAERMGNGMTRRDGKIAVLALGYNGAIGSLKAMGAKGSDEDLLPIVKQWRAANPNIVRFWKQIEEAWINGGRVGRLSVERDGADRLVRLPSGRAIRYRSVRYVRGFRTNPITGEPVDSWTFIGAQGFRTGTYGGSLTENITQAVARDLLGEALVCMEWNGLEVLGHVHDEVLVAGTDLDRVTRFMETNPRWAAGLPLAAEGFVTERYRKG